MNSSDKRLVSIVLAVMAVCLFYVWINYHSAFPQASLALPLTSDQITTRAGAVLRERRIPFEGFRNLTLFDPDHQARLYLERELGLEKANELMSGVVPVWRWRARWFEPPNPEEAIVYLRPDGRLLGFQHRIKETAPGARLESQAARLLAEAFLQRHSQAPHKLIAAQTEKRPNRDDHVFTWEQENFKAKDATIRRTVVMHGNRIGAYQEYLYVPEQWQRDFAALRSSNDLYAGIAQGLYAVLALASLVALGRAIRHHEIRWRPLLAIASVVAGFNFLNELNTIPFAIDAMPTSTPYQQMLLMAILQALGAATYVYLYVLAPSAAGAPIYRRRFPMFPALKDAFTWRGMATRSFFRATVAGFGMAAAHLAFLTAFYLIGAKFGVWSPQEVDYSDVLATPMPWVYPVAIALMAASAEEFWFRLLAVPLLGTVLKWRWLAISIPAFVWGFLHANYPQQPGYIRGLEVGIIGVAAGYMMYRFGIVATLVWHYVIDAFLIGTFLFRGGNWLYWIHGGIVVAAILAPLLVSIVLYRRNGRFLDEPEPEVLESPPERPAEELAPPIEPVYPARFLYAAAGLGAIALLLQSTTFGDFLRVRVTREEAEAKAAAAFQQLGLDASRWRRVSDFSVNLRAQDAEYLRQQFGAGRANEMLREQLIAGVWRVRYFQPLQPEEWIFYVNSAGELYRSDHVLDEKAKGAQLTGAEARQLAEDYLRTAHHLPVERLTLVDRQEDKKENRTDHSFVWEDPAVKAGEAHLRISLTLVGDQPGEYRRYFKLPEQWVRDFQKPQISNYALPAFIGVIAVPLITLFARHLRRQKFHWRVYGVLAAVALVLMVLEEGNTYPVWLAGYDTTTPLETYFAQMLAGRISSVLLVVAGVFVAALAADGYLQTAFGARRLPRPSIARIVAVALVVAGLQSFTSWLHGLAPGPRRNIAIYDLAGIDALVPGFSAWQSTLLLSAVMTLLIASVVAGGLVLLGSWRRMGLAAAGLVVVLAIGNTNALLQFPIEVLSAALVVGMVGLILATVGTDLISIWLGIATVTVAGQMWRYAQQPALQWNAAVLAGAMLVSIAAALLYTRKANS